MDYKWKNGYKWSRDYKRLKELLDAGYEVVCMADYKYTDGTKDRDICRARKIVSSKPEYTRYYVSARGITYLGHSIWREKQRSFGEWCNKINLKFMDIPQ